MSSNLARAGRQLHHGDESRAERKMHLGIYDDALGGGSQHREACEITSNSSLGELTVDTSITGKAPKVKK